MGTASHSIEIAADPAAVWDYVGDFNGLHRWHPGVLESALEEGGKVRRLKLKNGSTNLERLLEHDDARRITRYSITASALPLRRHAATIAVLGNERGSMVNWACEFESKGPPDAELEALFRQIFSVGLASLKEKLEKA
jgi:carbon monoxide dehydrogenase subunit G